MNNRRNDAQTSKRRLLPYFIDFVKFSAGFAAIIALGLLTLRAASAAMV